MPRQDSRPPSGMKDRFPDEIRRRQKALETIRRVFESYGYSPLETPAMERIEILDAHAPEGEKLIFRMARRGEGGARGDADLGLRYNFTVPLARVAAQYPVATGSIYRPYQIGPLWRADRPGRGRLREAVWCDVDMVGGTPPLADVEVMQLLVEALSALGLRQLTLRVNSRRVLDGVVEAYGLPADGAETILVALDKLNKAGTDSVLASLAQLGAPATSIDLLREDMEGDDPTARVSRRLRSTEAGRLGLDEMAAATELLAPLIPEVRIEIAPFLARALGYYTGILFELCPEGDPAGVALGGRYDGLIEEFAGRAVAACGGSLDFERILTLLPQDAGDRPSRADLLVTVWDAETRPTSLSLATELRHAGLRVELYPGEGKVGKQLRYAAEAGIPLCLILGPEEIARGEVAVRELGKGTQRAIAIDRIGEFLREQQVE